MDYVGNSKKSKEEPSEQQQVSEKVTVKKKVEKVVTGTVVEKKPSIGQKMKGVFFGAGFKSTGVYILEEVLLPALRDLIVDTVRRGTERAVYGDSSYRTPRGREYGPRTTYNATPVRRQVYETTARERGHVPDQPLRPRNRRGGLEFILQSRSEAEDVLEQLSAALEKYEYVTIADLRETLGLKVEYTDNKWGWTVLNDVEIRQIREGYLLDLPPAEAL
jgi:hypothetical protein